MILLVGTDDEPICGHLFALGWLLWTFSSARGLKITVKHAYQRTYSSRYNGQVDDALTCAACLRGARSVCQAHRLDHAL